jgi:hypothetical protein
MPSNFLTENPLVLKGNLVAYYFILSFSDTNQTLMLKS